MAPTKKPRKKVLQPAHPCPSELVPVAKDIFGRYPAEDVAAFLEVGVHTLRGRARKSIKAKTRTGSEDWRILAHRLSLVVVALQDMAARS